MATPRDTDAFHYFRDHETSGAWGVRSSNSGRVVATGLDKSDALAFALFMSGRGDDADEVRKEFQKYYPDEPTI